MSVIQSNTALRVTIDSDTSGNIVLRTGNLTILSSEPTVTKILNRLAIPSGNTNLRPSSPISGEIRFNTDRSVIEGYDGNSWVNLK
jgi:hypothetical protein